MYEYIIEHKNIPITKIIVCVFAGDNLLDKKTIDQIEQFYKFFPFALKQIIITNEKDLKYYDKEFIKTNIKTQYLCSNSSISYVIKNANKWFSYQFMSESIFGRLINYSDEYYNEEEYDGFMDVSCNNIIEDTNINQLLINIMMRDFFILDSIKMIIDNPIYFYPMQNMHYYSDNYKIIKNVKMNIIKKNTFTILMNIICNLNYFSYISYDKLEKELALLDKYYVIINNIIPNTLTEKALVDVSKIMIANIYSLSVHKVFISDAVVKSCDVTEHHYANYIVNGNIFKKYANAVVDDKKLSKRILKNINEINKINFNVQINKDIEINEIFNSCISGSNWYEELENSNINCMGLLLNINGNNNMSILGYDFNDIVIDEITMSVISMSDYLELVNFKNGLELSNKEPLINANGIGKGNAMIPLYINKDHWKFASQLMKPMLSIVVTKNPFCFVKLYYKIPFIILTEMIYRLVTDSEKVNDRFLQLFFAYWRTCVQILKDNHIAGIEEYIRKNLQKKQIEMHILGEIISTNYRNDDLFHMLYCKLERKERLQKYTFAFSKFLKIFDGIIRKEGYEKFIDKLENNVVSNDIINYLKINLIRKS